MSATSPTHATKAVVGIGAGACVACCIGPIVALLGALAALGVVATFLLGAAGLLIAAASLVALVAVRRRRATPSAEPVPVGLTHRRA